LLLEVQGFKEETRKAFLGAYKQLDERSKDIIQKRWLVDDDDKVTLQELALFYNISAERIRQLEANAIKKLQKFMVPALES